MSRQLFVNDRRRRLCSVPVGVTDDQASAWSAAEAFGEDAGAPRARRQREDPSGRRSLTGLELRRQRSI